MLNVTKEFLQSLLGSNIHLSETSEVNYLSLYLIDLYRFYKFQYRDHTNILVEPRSSDIRYEKLSKHLEEIEKVFGCRGVLFIRQLAKSRRRWLFEHQIPIIVPNQVVYLPESLTFWDEVTRPVPSLEGSFSPSEQLICLHVFYQPQEWFTGASLVKHLQVTSMTVSRALRVLFEMDVLVKSGQSPKIRYRRVDRLTYYNRTKARLKSPIEEVVYLRKNTLDPDQSRISGLSALALQTDLSIDPYEQSLAIHHMLRDKLASDKIDEFELIKGNEPSVRLEVWRYDPMLLSANKSVDSLSLVACFQSERDEPRIDAACKDLEEKACMD